MKGAHLDDISRYGMETEDHISEVSRLKKKKKERNSLLKS